MQLRRRSVDGGAKELAHCQAAEGAGGGGENTEAMPTQYMQTHSLSEVEMLEAARDKRNTTNSATGSTCDSHTNSRSSINSNSKSDSNNNSNSMSSSANAIVDGMKVGDLLEITAASLVVSPRPGRATSPSRPALRVAEAEIDRLAGMLKDH